jgi:hypothetical protein
VCDKCAKNQEDKNACLVLPAAALSRASLFYCFFFTFQLFHLRTIHTTGDISTPIMNWKPPSSTPFSQQHYQSLAKSARQETLYLNFYDHFPTYDFFIFSITSLQGGPRNWGYLRPQNEWAVGGTIALSPTTLPTRPYMSVVRDSFLLPFPHHYLTNEFLFFQLHRCRAVHTIGDISAPRMNGKPAIASPYPQQHYQQGGKRAW